MPGLTPNRYPNEAEAVDRARAGAATKHQKNGIYGLRIQVSAIKKPHPKTGLVKQDDQAGKGLASSIENSA